MIVKLSLSTFQHGQQKFNTGSQFTIYDSFKSILVQLLPPGEKALVLTEEKMRKINIVDTE